MRTWLGVVSATADTHGEPAAAMGSPRAIPAVAGVITALFLGACTQHLKFFPISAFPMYAHPVRDTTVYYLELKGRTRSGSIVDLRLEDEIHALADGRGRRILLDAFGPPATRRGVDKLLKTWSELYNARVPADERLSQIAVQWRSWDFESNPDDPNYGVIIQRFVYQVQ